MRASAGPPRPPQPIDPLVLDPRSAITPAPLPPGQHAPRPEQGGPLLVTLAGTTVVTTDGMQCHLEQLSSLQEQLISVMGALAEVTDTVAWGAIGTVAGSTMGGAASSARRSAAHVESALHAARTARGTTEQLTRSLHHAITAYASAETDALARMDRLASIGGAGFGVLARAALPAVAGLGLAGWLASALPDPGALRASLWRAFFLQHPEPITGPGPVRVVRMLTDGLDEGTSTFLGTPLPIAVLLGAAGVTGVRSSSRGLLAVGPLLGMFRETPVTVDRVRTAPVSAPAAGAVQRLARVPEVNQVRVEKYDAPDQPSRFVVYVGPTETFSPVADHEPWDLTSNVGGVGGLDVGAYRASELAMRDAGVTASSPVQFVGFSEGGLVASMLAASGDWNAAGLQTFGAPAGNIELPEGLDGMAVRNTDDFIPMLAGPQLDHHLLHVERRAFSAGEPLPTYHAAPAHQRDAYQATAAVIDAAGSAAVREQNAALDAFTADYASRGGSTITSMSYHAARVPDAAAPTLTQVTTEAR
ncbi:MAG: hypothetical protein HIU88_05810 [Acidobacteria bacterium]|nr:hypothetical protein [Acidobacteriota bacterium]